MSVVRFVPRDGVEGDPNTHIEAPLEAMKISQTVHNMLQGLLIFSLSESQNLSDLGGAPDIAIPLGSVSSKVLTLVVKYCQLHLQNPKPVVSAKKNVAPEDKDKRSYDIAPWEKEFLAFADGKPGWDDVTFFELILAAEFLSITDLLDLCMQTLANMIKGKTVEEFRKCFKITNDWTPEEEERVSKEVECFEER